MKDAKFNYPIHDKEMLAIIASLVHWCVELEGAIEIVQVLLDYKALEYFMTTKVLIAC